MPGNLNSTKPNTVPSVCHCNMLNKTSSPASARVSSTTSRNTRSSGMMARMANPAIICVIHRSVASISCFPLLISQTPYYPEIPDPRFSPSHVTLFSYINLICAGYEGFSTLNKMPGRDFTFNSWHSRCWIQYCQKVYRFILPCLLNQYV